MTIRRLSDQLPSEQQRAIQLLLDNSLPVDDLKGVSFDHFFVLYKESALCGLIGLEIHSGDGLLRSLVVSQSSRKTGAGKALVNKVEKYAAQKEIDNLYLLTETAEHFFLKLGYTKVGRDKVPDAIKITREFSELCPSSAVVMCKSI